MSTLNFNLSILIVLCICGVVYGECERDKSRTVRNIVTNELLIHYKSLGTKIPYKCPFFKERDKYIAHEEHKEREASTHWSCSYCGKSFIGEIYLDMHLSNRHASSVYNMDDAVCLADFCEIFRCDVLSGVAKATFWDVALCMEEDMKDLTADCVDLMRSCVPETLNWNTSKTLLAYLSKSVCSYLQCKTYYEAPSIEEKEPPGTGYIVGTVMLSIFFILYYCVAVNYFWLDTFSDVYDSDENITKQHPNSLFDSEQRQKHKSHHRPHSRKKQNFIQSEAASDRDIFQTRSGLGASVQDRDIFQARPGLSTSVQDRDIFQTGSGPSTSVQDRDIFQARSGLSTSVQDRDIFQARSGLSTSVQDRDIFQARSGLSTSVQDRDIFQACSGLSTSVQDRDIFQAHSGPSTSVQDSDIFQTHSGLGASVQDVEGVS